jgi:hypothetical protein
MRTGLFIVLLALAGCPSPPAPPPAPPPVTGYDDVKVGQVYVYQLLGGSTRTDEIVERTDDSIGILRSATVFGVSGKSEKVVERTRPPLAPSPNSGFPPGGLATKTGEETLTISGRSFPCEVRELHDGTDTLKEWTSPRYPFVVRFRSNDFETLRLVEIKDHEEEGEKK